MTEPNSQNTHAGSPATPYSDEELEAEAPHEAFGRVWNHVPLALWDEDCKPAQTAFGRLLATVDALRAERDEARGSSGLAAYEHERKRADQAEAEVASLREQLQEREKLWAERHENEQPVKGDAE